MEKTFEDILFEELKASDNNDNSISNNINNDINSSQTNTFSSVDYYMFSNLIISESIKKYYKDYRDFSVPYSFIAFYFSEASKYITLQTPYLKEFFVLFHTKSNNVSDAANIFVKSFPGFAKYKYVKKQTLFNPLKQGDYIEFSPNFLAKSIEYKDTSIETQSTIDCINVISQRINSSNSSEIFKKLYIEFVTTKNWETNKPSTNKPTPKTKPETLPTRSVIAPPKAKEEKQKVSRLKLPKLQIGKVYPKSFTHSRIDSAFFAWRFVEGFRTYEIINRYKLVKVKYTDGFNKKRVELFKTKKSNFDLF